MIAGNCGFTLAPLAPEDADYLRRMMAKVEGMPLPALETGVPWGWRSFADYLGALDGNVGLNVGFLVGHCALRRNVMGADAIGNEATPEQLDAMVAPAARLDRGRRPRLLDHAVVHALRRRRQAGRVALGVERRSARALRRGQAITRARRSNTSPTAACAASPTTRSSMMAEMTLAGRRPLNWNVLDDRLARARSATTSSSRRARTRRARGGKAIALTMPMLVEMNMSFRNYCALFMLPGWTEVMNLPVPERIAKLKDPRCASG